MGAVTELGQRPGGGHGRHPHIFNVVTHTREAQVRLRERSGVSAGDEELDPDGAPVRDGWVAMNVGVSSAAGAGGQAPREVHQAGD